MIFFVEFLGFIFFFEIFFNSLFWKFVFFEIVFFFELFINRDRILFWIVLCLRLRFDLFFNKIINLLRIRISFFRRYLLLYLFLGKFLLNIIFNIWFIEGS